MKFFITTILKIEQKYFCKGLDIDLVSIICGFSISHFDTMRLLSSFNFTQNFSFEGFLDTKSDVLLRYNDEDGADDDEGESQSILDEDVVEVIVLSVCQEEVDVIVGDMEDDERRKQYCRAAR